jgi:hypothetical protein
MKNSVVANFATTASRTEENDVMGKLVVNLTNKDN